MPGFSNTLENSVLNKVFRNTDFSVTSWYVSLHTADPGDTGANEVTGGSYARQSVSFAVASGGATENSTAVSFTNMPAVTVTHVGIWNAATGGTFIIGGPLSSPLNVPSGGTVNFAIGSIDITLE